MLCTIIKHHIVSMRILTEDYVGLKEKPEDTRYIQSLHGNKTRSTGHMAKLIIVRCALVNGLMPCGVMTGGNI